MDRSPPRHLSRRPSAGLRLPAVVEVVLALVGLALLATVVASQVDGGALFGVAARRPAPDPTLPGPPAATRPPRPGGPSVSTRPGSVSLLPDPSFERGLAGWSSAAGTRMDRVGSARDGRWAANFSATSPATPGVVASQVATVQAGSVYMASLWLRASRPGTAVRVELVELRGGRRFAVDTVGVVLDGATWRWLEVAHDGHKTGSVLALEVSAPGLRPEASVSLDLVEVRAGREPMSTGPG